MKQKALFVTLVLLLVAAFVLTSCSSGSETETPAQTTLIAPSTSAVTQVTSTVTPAYKLKFSHTIGAQVPFGQMCIEWMNKISTQSAGRVQFLSFWSQSLVNVTEIYRGLGAGIVDVSYFNTSLEMGRFPLNSFTGLSMQAWSTEEANNTKIWLEMQKIPEVAKEYAELKPVAFGAYGGRSYFVTTKKLVKTVDDVKGMKLYHTGGEIANLYQALGAAPIRVDVGDWYMSLERGLVEGIITSGFGSMDANGLMPLFKNFTKISPPVSISFDTLCMSNAGWNKLPPDIQKIFTDLQPWYSEERYKFERVIDQKVLDAMVAKGNIFYDMPATEVAKMQAAAKPLVDKWIADKTALGLPAQAVYDKLLSLMAQYK